MIDTVDSTDKKIQLVVHMSSSDIINSEVYLNWIRNFSNRNCIHIYLDEQYPSVNLESIYELQSQLNLVNENLFPLMQTQSDFFLEEQRRFDVKQKEMQREMKIVYAKKNMVFTIKPELSIKMDRVVKLDYTSYLDKIFEYYDNDPKIQLDGIDSHTAEQLSNLRKKINELKAKENEKDQPEKSHLNEESYPKILFLGTSSAMPTRFIMIYFCLFKIIIIK